MAVAGISAAGLASFNIIDFSNVMIITNINIINVPIITNTVYYLVLIIRVFGWSGFGYARVYCTCTKPSVSVALFAKVMGLVFSVVCYLDYRLTFQ